MSNGNVNMVMLKIWVKATLPCKTNFYPALQVTYILEKYIRQDCTYMDIAKANKIVEKSSAVAQIHLYQETGTQDIENLIKY